MSNTLEVASVEAIALQVGDEDSSNPATITFITDDTAGQTLSWDDDNQWKFDDNLII